MKSSLKQLAVAVSALAILTVATSASAFPTFSINPAAIKGTGAPITGLDTIKGGSQERLTIVGPNQFVGNGILTLDSFFNGANLAFVPVSSGFKLYITFAIADTLTSGVAGQAGSTYAITNLDFKIFADVNGDDLFSTATTATDPTASNIGDDKLLGYGSLIQGNATILTGGGSTGAALNSEESFFLCSGAGRAVQGGTVSTTGNAAACGSAIGTNFFFQPIPFYTLSMNEFNNTSAVFDNAAGNLALTGGSGSINFAIPEPGSIALIGIAAVAAGVATRRRRRSA